MALFKEFMADILNTKALSAAQRFSKDYFNSI